MKVKLRSYGNNHHCLENFSSKNFDPKVVIFCDFSTQNAIKCLEVSTSNQSNAYLDDLKCTSSYSMSINIILLTNFLGGFCSPQNP